MKIHTGIEQGSLAWLALRAGKVTASEMDALVTPLGKVKTGDGPKSYLIQKLAERWTGMPVEKQAGIWDLEQGQILEEQAKPAFVVESGIQIQNVGFIETDDGLCGCSPDALADKVGVEIKCPRLENHIRYLLDGEVPKDYVAQVQASMYVTGFQEWHFFSYRRRMPNLHLVVPRDEEYQEAISEALALFLPKLEAGFNRLCEINGGPPPKRAPLPPDASRATFDDDITP